MPRRKKTKNEPTPTTGKASSQMMAFVGDRKRRKEEKAGKKRSPPAGRQTVSKAKNEARVFLKVDDWSEAKAHHFVGLYAVLFENVYGVALDIKGNDWRGACSAARGMLNREFDNDRDRMLSFMRWVWSRENEREKWRRENGKPGNVIGWRLMFSSTKLLTEFKVHIARKTGA